jgi:hypothetical protein
VEKTLKLSDNLTKEDKIMIQFVQSLENLVEAQKTRYLGKVNFNYVKSLATQRAKILNDALELVLEHFPKSIESGSSSSRAAAQIMETFFLTDHAVETEDDQLTVDSVSESGSQIMSKLSLHNPITPIKTFFKHVKRSTLGEDNPTDLPRVPNSISSPVVPISKKLRRSVAVRTQDIEMLSKSGKDLLLDDDRSARKPVASYSNPAPTVHVGEGNVLGNLIENSPFVFLTIFVASAVGLKMASHVSITINCDVGLFLGFALFCVGLHVPRPSQSGIQTPAAKPIAAFPPPLNKQRSASLTLRRSLLLSPKVSAFDDSGAAIMTESELMDGEEDPLIKSPMDLFPKGAKYGSHLNCWSMPNHNGFSVRGPQYLTDKKKIESGEFLFPARGVDLFLTDACPENVGTNSGIFGGALREKPTLIINFRLPWGVFISYFEIPERFIPFIRKRYEFDYDGPVPDVDKMSAAERCTCRFLESDQETKNKTLKIVPVVVEGPWIVKSVVGGKPAIIGNKLPVNWVYQKASKGKALYLEADLDIVSSSAARGILSVARSHTQVLTLDLGFVVQGNSDDELPEQMLVGVRCHGIDPCTASPLPPMKNQFIQPEDSW